MAQPVQRISWINIPRVMIFAGRFIAPLFVFISAAGTLQAQMPGRWVQSFVLPGWNFDHIAFSDSAHGIIIADSGNRTGVIRTTNGGTSWFFNADSGVSSQLSFYNETGSNHVFDMPDSLDAYGLSPWNFFATHDGGLTWELDTNAFWPNKNPAFLHMFSASTGYALSGQPTFAVWNTSDSGRYFNMDGGGLSSDLEDAIFFDSLEFWGSIGNGKMVHSTSAGWLWDTVTVIDTPDSRHLGKLNDIDSLYRLDRIIQTPDQRHFYILFSCGGAPYGSIPSPFHEDFVETTDDGATWRIDSTLDSASIYRLSAPAPNKLWALTGPLYGQYAPFTIGSRYISYSPDDGHTWDTDSTRLGDTLTSMFWPDAGHAFITASRDNSLVVYRFVSSSSSVSAGKQAILQATIFPNPAVGSFIMIDVTPDAVVHLFDVLGRDMLHCAVPASGTLTLDVSRLPRGMYMAMAEHDGEMLSAGRIVLVEK